ncbi:hypothetical protein GCM10009660_41630 [Catellatospora bangladeshensis]
MIAPGASAPRITGSAEAGTAAVTEPTAVTATAVAASAAARKRVCFIPAGFLTVQGMRMDGTVGLPDPSSRIAARRNNATRPGV